MKVIVLDGNQRPSLAITRSLGRRGFRVTVGAETKKSLSSSSRFCADSFEYPSPYEDPEGFFRAVFDKSCELQPDFLVPVTDVTVGEILRRRGEFNEKIRIPYGEFEKYNLVSNKEWVVSQCRKLELPVPKSVLSTEFSGREAILEAARKLGYPLVVKPGLSRVRTEAGWSNTSVRYAPNENELDAMLKDPVFSKVPFLLQERIQGQGAGIFLLMKDGEVLASFAHKRLREKPPSGGVSVLCESIEPPAGAMNAATRLLASVKWNGIAMVEFKEDNRENVLKIMEVNARFWGSLELAISSGVDFPYLLLAMLKGEDARGPKTYKTGQKVRWELGDLDHLWIRLFRNPADLSLPSGAPSRVNVLLNFVADSIRLSVRNEVLRFCDPKPFLYELRQYGRNMIGPRMRSKP